MGNLRDFIILRNPDHARGFGVFMPRPIPSDFLELVAIHACSIPLLSLKSVHLLAVANSGVPMAAAILMHRRQKKLPGYSEDALSIVDPYRLNFIMGEPIQNQTQIIVDNSIKSLATIHSVSHKLAANKLFVRNVLKLIDYQDSLEQETQDRLAEIGMRVDAIFSLSDIISDFPSGQAEEIRRMIRDS